MKIADVVGKLSLSKQHASLAGKRWVIALPRTLKSLAGATENVEEEIIAIDEMGANVASVIGVSEGREAAAPFEPKRVPVDAYTACLLDEVTLDKSEISRLVSRMR